MPILTHEETSLERPAIWRGRKKHHRTTGYDEENRQDVIEIIAPGEAFGVRPSEIKALPEMIELTDQPVGPVEVPEPNSKKEPVEIDVENHRPTRAYKKRKKTGKTGKKRLGRPPKK